jgi:hypothetical protein
MCLTCPKCERELLKPEQRHYCARGTAWTAYSLAGQRGGLVWYLTICWWRSRTGAMYCFVRPRTVWYLLAADLPGDHQQPLDLAVFAVELHLNRHAGEKEQGSLSISQVNVCYIT